MPVTLFELANMLIMHDDDAECPFCEKTEWGEENHAEKCPFGLAYRALNEQRPTKRAADENDERGFEALQKEIIKYTDDTEKYLVENWIVENGYDTVFVDRYFATIKRIVNDAAKNRHSRR